MEKAAEKREDMRKTEQDRSRRRPERRDGNTGRGRAEGYGARKERTGSDRTEIHGRHGQAAGGEFRKQKYDVVYFLIAKKGRIIYNICILPYCRLP